MGMTSVTLSFRIIRSLVCFDKDAIIQTIQKEKLFGRKLLVLNIHIGFRWDMNGVPGSIGMEPRSIDYRIRVLWVYIWESFILRWLLETWDGKSLPRERGQKKREGSQRQLLGKHLNPGVGRKPSAREAGELGQNCAPGAVGGEIFHKKRRINIDRLEKGACGQILRKGLEFKFFKESFQGGCEIDVGVKKCIKCVGGFWFGESS